MEWISNPMTMEVEMSMYLSDDITPGYRPKCPSLCSCFNDGDCTPHASYY